MEKTSITRIRVLSALVVVVGAAALTLRLTQEPAGTGASPGPGRPCAVDDHPTYVGGAVHDRTARVDHHPDDRAAHDRPGDHGAAYHGRSGARATSSAGRRANDAPPG